LIQLRLRIRRFKSFNTFKLQVVESFEGSENGTTPDVLAQEIVEALEAALEQIREITADLSIGKSTQENLGGR